MTRQQALPKLTNDRVGPTRPRGLKNKEAKI